MHYFSLRSTLLLGMFAFLGVGIVAVTKLATDPMIARNQRRTLLIQLEALLPNTNIDNDLATDTLEVNAPEFLGTETSLIYRGRKQSLPVVAILNATIPYGYAGPINLLIAVRPDGVVQGVRVTSITKLQV
jgi:electron transport complex protein RnfG